MIEVGSFHSLDEIPFDTLYAASLPKLEAGTFVWPDHVQTGDARKAFVAERFRDILSLPTGLGVWVTGPDRFVIIGFGDGTAFHMVIALIAPDEKGSRAYAYDPDVIAAYVNFFKGQGYTSG